MKKLIIFSLFVLLCKFDYAQNSYETEMKDGINLLFNAQTDERLVFAAERFDHLSQTAKHEWLPLYYKGLTYTTLAFRTSDKEKRKKNIDNAQLAIDLAFKINSGESELFALQGMIYEGLITLDLYENGRIYLSKTTEVLNKAVELNPENPRAVYLQGLLALYTPEVYGGGKESAYPILTKAQGLFEVFTPETVFSPVWGAEDCNKMIATLKNLKTQ